MRRYIDEYFSETSHLIPKSEEIVFKIFQMSNDKKSPEEIAKYLQDWLYLFDDEKETESLVKFINVILNR